ncbi:enoyl-CoA hydratase [Litorivivens lipolytica]|uniref:Enoyl-CoA hydratase n=1 Tax=Litorivivens lipolytica TaxID=1524264 RepID=A0A7W4Z5J0_9GAMM|nr:enoyl-CoA hydratase-related protein [Litorivivens lipolytica]MBB3047253.1 enoyl-CoA hydratase [Litorivivens lipolytica]
MTAVIFEQQGAVARIILNRPEAKNTLNAEVFVRLNEAWEEVRNNDAIRVAVITASGEEDFCCGGDLGSVIPLWTGARQPQNEIEEKLLADPMIVDRVMLKDRPLHKPVIAAINGRALGGGCELLQATDIRIAADTAIFGLPEPKSGIVPGAGSLVRLARQLPYAHAMKLLLTAEPVDAVTAQQMGLISEVVSPDQLQARANELADIVAANAPLAMQAIKRTVLESHTLPWEDAFKLEMEQTGAVMMTKDAREGPRAFKEKRKPVFKGE